LSQEDEASLTDSVSSSPSAFSSTRSPSDVTSQSLSSTPDQSAKTDPVPLMELPSGLILRTTADDVCLMGTMNGKLELLAVLPGLVVDWEGQYAYRGLNRKSIIFKETFSLFQINKSTLVVRSRYDKLD
jgi:hypothetical protein